MAGGGIGDFLGTLGSGLSSLAGQGGGGGGGGTSGTPDLGTVQPQDVASNVLTNPLVGSEEAVSGSNPAVTGPQQQQQQPPQQPPQPPTFTQPPPQQAPQPVPYLSPEARNAAIGGAPTSGVDPNAAQPITAQVGQQPGISPETQTGLSPQAEVAAGYRPPEATDADLAQAAEERQRKQAAIGASSVSTGDQQGAQQQPQQQGNQQRQQNPLTQAGNLLKNLAKPGSAPAHNYLADLLTGGPAALIQDLLGLTNQVGSAYGPQEYGSQGATEHGYGYGAAQPPAQETAAVPQAPQSAAPQPPTAAVANAPVGDKEAMAAQAEKDVQAEIAQQEAQRKDQSRLPGGNISYHPADRGITGGPPPAQAPVQAAQRPPVTPASLTTGETGRGAAASPIAQGEIQISGYSRHGAPPMKPSQASVDVSPLREEASSPQTVHRMAQMVSQEVSLRPGNTRAQIVQLETLRNRALYGKAGNGRYPDGTRAPTSLAQAGQTVSGRYSGAGYAGYYPDYSTQRVSPQQLEKFKREVYDVVFPPDGSPGSNLSDVGWGPMTGNASNDPRRGERGMVAKHQYMRGTQGYSMRKAGGDDYFREHVRPGDALPQAQQPTMTAVEPQRLYGEFNFGPRPDLEGVVNATAKMAPGGLPTQDWRRSTNVEEARRNPLMTPLSYPTAPAGAPENVVNDWRAGLQSPQRNTEMARQLGSEDIDPLLDQIAQQWAMQLMGGNVPMPRPRPRM